MVVLSMEAFENLQFESEVYFKLQEAEREAELTEQRYSSKDVLKAMKAAIGGNRLYKLEYLPVARKDMLEIVRYISRELQNPDAADRLAGSWSMQRKVCCSFRMQPRLTSRSVP